MKHPRATVACLCWPTHAQPRVRLAGCFPFSPEIAAGQVYWDSTVALHQHFYHGRLQLEDGTFLTLRPGDVTFSPPNASTHYDLAEKGRHWCVHFDPVPARSSGVQIPLHLPLGTAGAYVTERLRALADLHTRGQRAPSVSLLQTASSLSLQELILWLALNVPERAVILGPKSEMAVMQARAVMDERFHEPLSIREITRNTGLSRNYLTTRFRQRFGITPESYLLRRRIEVARHLLLTSNLLVKEVAFQVGIADQQYFNKQFRRSVGLSPTAFRVTNRMVK